jgi:DNA-binding TFAR19-related protein (PDSD5 family)
MGKDYKPLGNPKPLRLPEDTEIMIEAIAKKRGESNQDVMRSLLEKGAREELLLEFGADRMLELVRRAVSETNKPFEMRVAKIMAKSAISSGVNMYLLQEYLGQIGKKDVREVSVEARKRAVAKLREPDNVESDG